MEPQLELQFLRSTIVSLSHALLSLLFVFSFDLMVCNPPFFSSLASTGVNPNRSAAATANELVCPGGEEEFVAQMIRESRERPLQIR